MKPDQLLFLFLSFSLNSCDTSKTRSDTEMIKQIFEYYSANTLKEDYDACLNMIYPEVFSGKSKSYKVDNIKKSMHNSSYDMFIKQINNDSTYSIEKHGSNKYSMIKVTTKGTFYLKQRLADSLAHIKQFNNMCETVGRQLGNRNISCNLENNSIDITIKSHVYFISDPKYKRWFLLSADVPEDVEKFIPLEVRKKFGVY